MDWPPEVNSITAAFRPSAARPSPARGRVQPGPHQQSLDLRLRPLNGDAGGREQEAEPLGGLGTTLSVAGQGDTA